MSFFKRNLLVVIVSLFAWISIPVCAQTAQIADSYINESIGVRVSFSDQWQVSTSREDAPPTVQPNFPENKGPNDSPLFIGVYEDQQLFSRLLLEPYFGTLSNYSSIIGQVLNAQGLQVLSAKLAVDGNSAQYVYRHPQLGFVFIERISILEAGTAIRAAVWMPEAVAANYQQATEEFFDAIGLHDVVGGGSDWEYSWAALQDRLIETDIAGVTITEQESVQSSDLLCTDPGNTLLWEISDAGSDAEVYLFGSIHVGKAEFYPLAEVIESEFRAADYLVFEVDPGSVADPSVVMEMQTRGMMPQGQTLADVVSAETVTKLRDVMRSMGLPADNFMAMQPWFLSVVLSGLQINALGFSPQYGIESYLLGNKPADAEILELESIQQQLEFLVELNSETYLNYSLDSFAEGTESIESLIDAWQCADKPALEEILFSELDPEEGWSDSVQQEMEALKVMLFDNRNITMADGIVRFLEQGQGSYFVVVGTAHLLGEGSVVDLLSQRGYEVSPVSLP